MNSTTSKVGGASAWAAFESASESALEALQRLDETMEAFLDAYSAACASVAEAQRVYPGDPVTFPVPLTPRSVERAVLQALASIRQDEAMSGTDVRKPALAAAMDACLDGMRATSPARATDS
jgi:hypothetical protein